MLYFDKMMPMGLCSAVYVCQRITNSITYIHKSFGYWVTNYLDDFGSAEKAKDAFDSFQLLSRIFNAIGLQEASEKAVAPTTRMGFLGNVLDLQKMTIEVSQDRILELTQLIDRWLVKSYCSLQQLQSLIGKLSFVTNCVRAGRIFISRLIEKIGLFHEKQHIVVDDQIKADLRWWKQFLPVFNGMGILWLYDYTQPDSFIASDASLVGGGAVCEKEFFHFKFDQNILTATNNIAQRELFTILIAVKLWSKKLFGKLIRFSTDNEVSMHVINKGRSQDQFMLTCIRELAWVCANNHILIKAVFLPGKHNILPDTLSRWHLGSEARHTVRRMTDNTWKRRLITQQLTKFVSPW